MENKRKIWLENAIFDYIIKTNRVDSIDITLHFKLRVDITLMSLRQLVDDMKVARRELWGIGKHEYYVL
jgi:hypothetical protein